MPEVHRSLIYEYLSPRSISSQSTVTVVGLSGWGKFFVAFCFTSSEGALYLKCVEPLE